MRARPGPWRVRDAATFDALRRTGRRARSSSLSVTWLPATDGPPRVAYAVGRRVGTAVARNRLRRRLRAIMRAMPLAPGCYLVGAGPDAAGLDHAALEAELCDALDALGARSGMPEVAR